MNETDKSILGQRAHDIAVALLPDLLKENKISLYAKSGSSGENYNTDEIIREYGTFYEDLLKGLQEFFGDEL